MKLIEQKIQYDTKVITYPNGDTVVRKYEKKIERTISSIESDKKKRTGRVSSSSDVEKKVRQDSLNRTRDLIIQYGKQHIYEWKSFWTFTFAENLTDIDQANKHFDIWKKQFIRTARKFYGKEFEFKYLGVPEFQKRGAVHYHLITNVDPKLFPELMIHQKTVIDNKGIAKHMYDIRHWKHGYTSVFDFDLCVDLDRFNPVLYMMKYLFKDIDNRLFGRNKVLKSNNLKKGAEILLDSEKDDDKIKQIYDYCYLTGTFEIKEKDVLPTTENALAFKEIVLNNKCLSDKTHYTVIGDILQLPHEDLAF